jgi:hypothetical protein
MPMLIDHFNEYARARSLGIDVQTKTMREHSMVFSDVWFGIYF